MKNILKLTQKKYRREMNLCIVEGEKLVREHRERAVKIYYRKTHGAGAPPHGEYLDAKTFDALSSLETSQGVLAIVPIPKSGEVTFPYLVLDGVQDPGNVGTLLRTAAAFGFKTVFCVNCADVWSQKVIRAAMGAQFHLNIHSEFTQVPAQSILYIADLGAGDFTRPTGKFGLVLGNEGQGPSSAIKSMPHTAVTIATENVESLNVAVAGGILMYKMCNNLVD